MHKFANTFEVGADPEFVVLYSSNGALRNVLDIGQGPAGWDHGGRCAELRPEKALGTFTLVKRMQEIINKYPKLTHVREGFKWRAGAYFGGTGGPVTLGGHIHFNLSQEKFPKDGLAALDRLAQYLEAVEIMPSVECATRRLHSNYGGLGAIRTDTPDKHIEYRTMASWLFDPWVAFLTLTAAKLAVVSPETALDNLSQPKTASRDDLVAFVSRFRGKDINADRLLDRLARDKKWLNVKPDVDMKDAWARPL